MFLISKYISILHIQLETRIKRNEGPWNGKKKALRNRKEKIRSRGIGEISFA